MIKYYGSMIAAVEPATLNPSSEDLSSSMAFLVYQQRWMVLFIFSLLSLMNNWIWITWSPIANDISDVWNVPISRVNDLSTVYMYVYIPLSFPALIALNKYKLKWGLGVGSTLNFVGALVRYLGMDSYRWVYVGTFFCALCQTLTLAMPPLISTLWFPECERGLATSLGVLANQLGAAMGLGATILVPLLGPKDDSMHMDPTGTLQSYLLSQLILSGISLALIFLCIQSDSPPTPPSEAASSQKPTTYLESIQLMVGTTSGSLFCIVYGLTLGVLYSMATFLSQYFVTNSGHDQVDDDNLWTEKEAGYLGMLFILIGLPGSLLAGELLDKTHSAHRTISISLLFCSLLSMFSFYLFLQFVPYCRWLAYATISCLGFFLTGFISVGFEYGTAISYPADEAAVAGVLNVAAQISGWALVSAGGILGVGQLLNAALVGVLIMALVTMVVFVRANSVRPGEID